jgi:hypothetical protein
MCAKNLRCCLQSHLDLGLAVLLMAGLISASLLGSTT